MNAKRIFSLTAGGVAALLGVLVLVAGSALIVVHQNERDDDGYYGSGSQRLSTSGLRPHRPGHRSRQRRRLDPRGRARPRPHPGRA